MFILNFTFFGSIWFGNALSLYKMQYKRTDYGVISRSFILKSYVQSDTIPFKAIVTAVVVYHSHFIAGLLRPYVIFERAFSKIWN